MASSRLDLPADALAVLRTDSKDSIYFRVGARDDAFVAGIPTCRCRRRPRQIQADLNGVYRGTLSA